jgi:hypothetical protein
MPIHGVDTIDLDGLERPFSNLADSPEGWRSVFEKSLASIRCFLAARDPWAIVAKTSTQLLANTAARTKQVRDGDLSGAVKRVLSEAVEVELLLALALMQTSGPKKVPASPASMERLFPELGKAVFAFLQMQPAQYPAEDEREHVIRRARAHTLYSRNIFMKTDCEAIVPAIFRRFDDLALKELGFRLSEMFTALVAVGERVSRRVDVFRGHIRAAHRAESESEVLPHIQFFCEIEPVANRAWSMGEKHCRTVETLQWAAFQLSELCNTWIYRLDKQELRSELGDTAVAFFEKIAIHPGELTDKNPEHFFMNNPVWRRPFVALDKGTLFLPLPSLFYGFPFLILEQFISGNGVLESAYSEARSAFLEETVERRVASAMPSARTFRGVMWRDNVSGILYENDVVAVIGNTVFLFEAKSGRLDEAARRGGERRLLRNFKELFVEPAEQAQRLETYINTMGKHARLWLKHTGDAVNLHLDTPKVVHKFSICIEHFASLTSARHNLKALGAVRDDEPWAPVLSIGELTIVWRFLDTEVSFFHYLTRRATLEELIDFDGDEQDILSLYLINGLCINAEEVEGKKVRFIEIDGIVKTEKTPRHDRREFELYGVPLSDYWRSILEEVYGNSTLRHRFDIIQVVLNQDPLSLASIEQVVRKWRKGFGGRKSGDILFSRSKIGKRTFVLAYYLLTHPIDGTEWTGRSREIARNGAAPMFEASDCAVLLRVRKSKERTYDALSFYRLIPAPHP